MNGNIPGEVVALSPLMSRILAPNPSPFTYTGTQSFLVGRTDLAVIDPGPDDLQHHDALLAAIAGRPVRAILCTHTHRDHSPGARPLSAATGAPIIGCAPLSSEDVGPRADASFDTDYAPDHILADGERVSGEGWDLEALATPGHTSNHLCFALAQEHVLFSGDHVMGWSTTVVIPPDGDMAAYMASLEKLQGRAETIYYPAHGDSVTRPQQLLRGMLGHRKQRERQILKLLDRGEADLRHLVSHMYKGLDPRLHGGAGQSVLAHLIDLEARGLVVRDGECWRIAA